MKRGDQYQAVYAVLLIDGQCYLCNRITQFVVKRDKAKVFRFATLQSPIGQRLLQEGQLSLVDMNTFVMVQGDDYFIKSDAALRVLSKLDGWWRILYLFIIVPRSLRDVVYDINAQNRFRWFGAPEECLIPTHDLRSRFLEDGVLFASKESEGHLDEK
ncbi:hypothetical protein BK133_02085 [Paenibacillus sp. FSL H8-0548]|nr:hypothetical protein BK133_02085 [Paenibacillus sp. FSL H8-0548]